MRRDLSTIMLRGPRRSLARFFTRALVALLALHWTHTQACADGQSNFIYDFRQSPEPWVSWMKVDKTEDGVRLTLPGKLDPNHLGSAGPLWLALHLPMWAPGAPGPLDMRIARLRVKLRGTGIKTNGAKLSFWMVAQVPPKRKDSFHSFQAANWQLAEPDLARGLEGGGWPTVTVQLKADDQAWKYAGSNILQGEWGRRYMAYPIEDVLKNMDATLHIAFVGGDVDHPPEGILEVSEIAILGAHAAKPDITEYDFDWRCLALMLRHDRPRSNSRAGWS